MGSNAVEEVPHGVHVSQGNTNTSITECSVESVATVTQPNNSSTNMKPHVRKLENTTAIQPKFTVWRKLELSLLSVIIVTVWGLLALPTVFFHVVS